MKFLNCKIDVSQKVFKPRIETEFWVRKEISNLKSLISRPKPRKLNILDIFSGSGCIGIAILKNLKNSYVDFADISQEALQQIRINLKLNKISEKRYKIYQSNLFENIKKGRKGSDPCKLADVSGYDFIFANPPYVALDRINEVQKGVLKKDPHIALFAGKEGMDTIKRFLPKAKNYLKPKGKIFMEFDSQQKNSVEKIIKKIGFKGQFHEDQFKKYRWVGIEL